MRLRWRNSWGRKGRVMERLKRPKRHLRMGCGESLIGYDNRDLSVRRRPAPDPKPVPQAVQKETAGAQGRPK